MGGDDRGAHRSAPLPSGVAHRTRPPALGSGRSVVMVGLVVAGALGGVAAGAPTLALAATVVAVVVTRSRRGRVERAQREARAAALAPAIDLCTVVLGAGGTIRDCIEALASDGPAPVATPAADALARADGGQPLDRSLRWLQLELGPAFQPLTGPLLLAREQGGSIGALLTRLSVEAGASRRRAGELRARRLPVLLLVPLVVCALPAVVIGTIVPLVLVALGDLQP